MVFRGQGWLGDIGVGRGAEDENGSLEVARSKYIRYPSISGLFTDASLVDMVHVDHRGERPRPLT